MTVRCNRLLCVWHDIWACDSCIMGSAREPRDEHGGQETGCDCNCGFRDGACGVAHHTGNYGTNAHGSPSNARSMIGRHHRRDDNHQNRG